MGGIFNIQGLIYKLANLLADILILSLIWLFTVIIGIGITFGASTTAIYYVATKYFSNKQGYMIRDYIKSFKENFIQSTIIFFIITFATVINVINIVNISYIQSVSVIILPIQYFILLELFLTSTYIYPLMARFKMKTFNLIKTAFFMANKHITTSLICIFIAFFIFLLCYLYPFFIFVSIGLYSFVTSYFIMKLLKKYRPEIEDNNLVDF